MQPFQLALGWKGSVVPDRVVNSIRRGKGLLCVCVYAMRGTCVLYTHMSNAHKYLCL